MDQIRFVSIKLPTEKKVVKKVGKKLCKLFVKKKRSWNTVILNKQPQNSNAESILHVVTNELNESKPRVAHRNFWNSSQKCDRVDHKDGAFVYLSPLLVSTNLLKDCQHTVRDKL